MCNNSNLTRFKTKKKKMTMIKKIPDTSDNTGRPPTRIPPSTGIEGRLTMVSICVHMTKGACNQILESILLSIFSGGTKSKEISSWLKNEFKFNRNHSHP